MILSITIFGLCAIALVVTALVERRRDPEATAGDLFDRLLADRTARLAMVVIWWWLGWHFLAGQTL
ncbi:DUF6186 family protein [Leucobacter sp.]